MDNENSFLRIMASFAGNYILYIFILNLVALGVGLILKRFGKLQAAKIMSYISLVGISFTILMVIILIIFSYFYMK